MDVIQNPTNRPKIGFDHKDIVFETIAQKYKAVALEVKACHIKGQPFLIGTTSILQSEKVAKYLDELSLPYKLLNAKSVEQEIHLISLAGLLNQGTIATLAFVSISMKDSHCLTFIIKNYNEQL